MPRNEVQLCCDLHTVITLQLYSSRWQLCYIQSVLFFKKKTFLKTFSFLTIELRTRDSQLRFDVTLAGRIAIKIIAAGWDFTP